MTDRDDPGGTPGAPPVALTVAGSDSGGGAGIQADLKTFHAFGVFGTSALTAVTVQDTRGVSGFQKIAPEIVAGQIEAVAEDLEPSACKSGMLGDREIIRAVAESLRGASVGRYVLDPVMVAQSGDPLLEEGGVEALRDELLPLADLVTPNLHEAGLLLGREVEGVGAMGEAAGELVEAGASAVLLKGGHLEGDEVVDLLVHPGGRREWRADRIATRDTHGTGCTLSSAVAAGLALGRGLEEAVDVAVRYTRQAIATAPGLGHGHGPLNHWAPVPAPR